MLPSPAMATLEPSLDRGYPHENASKVVWRLAWPAVALNSLAVVNNLLDTGFVGRLEPAAITAQGAAIAVIFLLFQSAFALGTAATALVSRSYGAQELGDARTATIQSLNVSILIGIALTAICALMGVFVPYWLIREENDQAIRLMQVYVAIYGCSLPAQHIIQVFAGSLRGIGDTKSPMMISGLQIVLHIIFNFLLIFPTRQLSIGLVMPGANWGLAGAGAAFALSSWIAALVYMAYSRRTPLGSTLRFGGLRTEWVQRILRIAWPAAVQGTVRTAALGAFMIVLKFVPDSDEALAAVRGGFTIESIMFMPGFGLSMAAASLVGQSLGMGRPDRAERLAWTAAHYSGLVIFGLSVPIFIFAPQIAAALVPSDPRIAGEMTMMMRFMCTTEVLFGYSMVMTGALQGAGDTVRPMWITIVSLWGLRVPLAFIFALGLKLGASGAWMSMALTQGVSGVLSMWLFRRGHWKSVEV